MSDTSHTDIEEADRRIRWVLEHENISPWLKESLRAALECDPVTALNDAELLLHLIRARTDAVVQETVDSAAKRAVH